jgi:hypothetical protein
MRLCICALPTQRTAPKFRCAYRAAADGVRWLRAGGRAHFLARQCIGALPQQLCPMGLL